MNEIFTKKSMKIGLLFGGVVVLINLLVGIVTTFVPLLVFVTLFTGVLVWIIMVTGGYVNGYAHGFTKENMTDNLKKAVGAGLWAALVIGVLSGVIAVILSLVPQTTILYGVSYTANNFTILGDIFSFFGQLLGALISGLLWFVAGGIAYAYYPVSKLPTSLVSFLDKVKNFANK